MEKPIPTKIFPPITGGADIVLKRLEFLVIPRNLFKSAGKIVRKRRDWFCFSLVEKLVRHLQQKLKAQLSQLRNY